MFYMPLIFSSILIKLIGKSLFKSKPRVFKLRVQERYDDGLGMNGLVYEMFGKAPIGHKHFIGPNISILSDQKGTIIRIVTYF